MIFAAVKCVKCGEKLDVCDCREKCSCNWMAERGTICNNPETIRCSLKLKYGKWNRRTRRYE